MILNALFASKMSELVRGERKKNDTNRDKSTEDETGGWSIRSIFIVIIVVCIVLLLGVIFLGGKRERVEISTIIDRVSARAPKLEEELSNEHKRFSDDETYEKLFHAKAYKELMAYVDRLPEMPDAVRKAYNNRHLRLEDGAKPIADADLAMDPMPYAEKIEFDKSKGGRWVEFHDPTDSYRKKELYVAPLPGILHDGNCLFNSVFWALKLDLDIDSDEIAKDGYDLRSKLLRYVRELTPEQRKAVMGDPDFTDVTRANSKQKQELRALEDRLRGKHAKVVSVYGKPYKISRETRTLFSREELDDAGQEELRKKEQEMQEAAWQMYMQHLSKQRDWGEGLDISLLAVMIGRPIIVTTLAETMDPGSVVRKMPPPGSPLAGMIRQYENVKPIYIWNDFNRVGFDPMAEWNASVREEISRSK